MLAVSGFVPHDEERAAISASEFRFLAKPSTAEQLPCRSARCSMGRAPWSRDGCARLVLTRPLGATVGSPEVVHALGGIRTEPISGWRSSDVHPPYSAIVEFIVAECSDDYERQYEVDPFLSLGGHASAR